MLAAPRPRSVDMAFQDPCLLIARVLMTRVDCRARAWLPSVRSFGSASRAAGPGPPRCGASPPSAAPLGGFGGGERSRSQPD
eukprot:2081677-Pyramimonas_sp.AAC.1